MPKTTNKAPKMTAVHKDIDELPDAEEEMIE